MSRFSVRALESTPKLGIVPAVLAITLMLGHASAGLAALGAVVSAGGYHSCAVTAAGRVKCWGYNADGELGDGTTTDSLTPVDVSGIVDSARGIAANEDHTCAVVGTGLQSRVRCWGSNAAGQLGDGTTASSSIPVESEVTFPANQVAAGGLHTCAVDVVGGVQCWGSNYSGQLGDGTVTNRLTPTSVSGLGSGVQAVATGSVHTCALTAAGGVKCWGSNGVGQLGDGTLTNRSTPVDVGGLTSGVQAIATGDAHSCALTTGGGVKCWGYNFAGELGDGTITFRTTPVDVSGLPSGVQAIAAGRGHTCALTIAGGVKCWGGASYVPVDVGGLASGVQAIAAGGFGFVFHDCALTSAGGVKCWGFNGFGELGDGTYTGSSTPVDVSGFDQDCVAMVKPTVKLTRLDRPGDGAMTMSGEMVIPISPPIDPLTNGVHLLIDRAFPKGSVLDDATIPGGSYDGTTKKGWKVNSTRTSWTYVNTPNDLPSRITSAQVKLSAKAPGLVQFRVKGRAGDFGVGFPPGLPLVSLFSVEAPFSINGQCSKSSFIGSSACFRNGSSTVVTCK